MKRPGLTPHLLAATLFLAGGLRAAETQSAPSAAKPPREAGPAPAMKATRAEDLLRRFDKNGDGKLDEDEQAEAHEIMLREQMTRRAAKAAAAPEAGQPFRQKMLELFDKNHDGRLDDDERAEARKYAEEHGLGEGGAVRTELMKRFDKNADGKLDAEEMAALSKFLQERRAETGANTPVPAIAETPAAAIDQAKLDKIAEAVAKRRAERQQREAAKQP